ncbi:MAG: hypothetical protein R3A52_09825 [Polyangiales bacterium]
MPARPYATALCVLFALALSACAGSRDTLRPPPDHDPMANVRGRQLYDQGVALARRNDLVRAEQYLAESMTRGMPQRQVLPMLLRVCVAASRFRAAVGYARPYLDAHPNEWALRYLIATIEAGLGEHQAARRDLESVLEQREAHAPAHFSLATLLRENFNDPVSADRHYRRYLEVEPQGEHAEEARSSLLREVTPVQNATDAATPAADATTPTPTAPTPAPAATEPASAPATTPAATPRPTAGPAPRPRAPGPPQVRR